MWETKDNAFYREFCFKDFKEAFEFMKKVAIICEEANHHPYWWNNYNRIGIKLCTHDLGNRITKLDYELAEKINKLL
ncbi:MAG: 4a-hydroxytetrahydrobiopterin dehydratase [Bacteroidota bacterium]